VAFHSRVAAKKLIQTRRQQVVHSFQVLPASARCDVSAGSELLLAVKHHLPDLANVFSGRRRAG
jgi:hypothetical protein